MSDRLLLIFDYTGTLVSGQRIPEADPQLPVTHRIRHCNGEQLQLGQWAAIIEPQVLVAALLDLR